MPESTAGSIATTPDRSQVEIVFSRGASGDTFVRRQRASYPYHLCRPHRFAGDPAGMATLYLQSCAGGLFQGDRIVERIVMEAGARAHVTTPAATIVHATESGFADQEVLLTAEQESFIEHLPEPLILFPRSQLRTRRRVQVHPTATVILCESWLTHDPAGQARRFDLLASETIIEMSTGEIVVLDRSTIRGGELDPSISSVMGGYAAHGSMLVLHRQNPAGDLAEAMRRALDDLAEVYGGASELPFNAGASLRVLANDGSVLQAAMLAAWSALRRSLTGVTPQLRRR